MRSVTTHSPRRTLILFVVVLAGIATIAVAPVRTVFLQAGGRILVVNDPVGPADVIVITNDGGAEGVLEAADLFHHGIATRVAVFADPPDEIDREFIRRGAPYEDRAERSTRELKSLGVSTVEQIPRGVAGTEDEGEVLPGWCDEQRLRSIVVVSTSDHSRRVRRVLRRAMKGHQTTVTVRFSRYSQFDPDRWWQTRGGVRIAIVEFQKLLLDLARHPIS
jgi:hypothetical protein